MHKAFLFDCGNVLIDFSRDHHLDVFVGTNQADRWLVANAVFSDWCLQDAGMSSADYCSLVKAKLPERLHKAACNIVLHWPDAVYPVTGMDKILCEIQAAGGKLILLSNMPDVYPQLIKKIPCVELFDDLIFSFPIRKIKPHKDFFEFALEKNALRPEDCLFVDDTQENIDGAKALGIAGFRFDKRHPEEFFAYIHNNELNGEA